MTSRIGRRTRVAAAVAVVALAATACDSAVSGSPTAGDNQYEFTAKQAFAQAVEALSSRPLARYTTTVAGADGEKVSMAVTRTGAAYGTSDLDGQKMTLAVLADKLYVRAGKELWNDLGAKSNETKKFTNRFTLVEPDDIGFDPGELLSPKKVAQVLKDKVAEEQQGAGTAGEPATKSEPPKSGEPQLTRRTVERLKLDDGTEVFRMPVGQYTVDVSVAKPYRIVSTDVPLAGSGGDPLVPDGSRTTFSQGGEQDLRKLYGSLANAAKAVRGAGVLVPDFQLRQGSGKLDCAVGGNCTAKVKVSNTYRSQPRLPVTQFDVYMKVNMSATGLGSKTCTDTAGMRPNKSISMSCSADFALAPSYTPRSYPVRASWSIVATGKYNADTKKISAALKRDLASLLEEI